MKAALRPLWEGAVDSIYDVDGPDFVIRIGTGNPFKSSVQAALDAIPQGMETGFNDLIPPGLLPWDMLGEFVIVDVNSSAINTILDDILGIVETGQAPSIDPDTVFLDRIGIALPMSYTSGPWSIGGQFSIGLYDGTLHRFQGAYIGGEMNLNYQSPVFHVGVGAGMLKFEGLDPVGSFGVNAGY